MLQGETTLAGDITSVGYIGVNGVITVSETSTFDAGRLNMDGNGWALWNINAALTINADDIDTPDAPAFDGTINIASPLAASLTLNLTDPGDSWEMAGNMNLGGAIGYFNRVMGSPVVVSGTLDLPSNRAQIAADTAFAPGSVVSLAAGSASLRMNARSRVEPGAVFSGDGEFRNGPDGEMVLVPNLNLANVGLANQGVLSIGEGDPGVVQADRFQNFATGTLRVELGGTAAGASHDLMIVTGPATLAGTLEVRLLGAGAAQYRPQVGDTFTVLTASDGIVGTFDSVPDTLADSGLYEWAVVYNSNDVTIELVGFQGNDASCSIADLAPPYGQLTFADISRFLEAFSNQNPAADLAAPAGAFTFADISAFLAAFAAGCP